MDYNNQNNQNESGTYTTYTGTGSTSPIIEEKKRGMGVLGAFLGALAGGVVWVLIGCLGYIIGWVSVLIFFLAQWGYNKFSGAKKGAETDKFGVIISAVIGLVMIIPATYVTYGFVLWRDLNRIGSYSFMEVLRDMPLYMGGYELWGEFAKNLGLGYLFTGVAAFYMITGNLGNKEKKNKKEKK